METFYVINKKNNVHFDGILSDCRRFLKETKIENLTIVHEDNYDFEVDVIDGEHIITISKPNGYKAYSDKFRSCSVTHETKQKAIDMLIDIIK